MKLPSGAFARLCAALFFVAIFSLSNLAATPAVAAKRSTKPQITDGVAMNKTKPKPKGTRTRRRRVRTIGSEGVLIVDRSGNVVFAQAVDQVFNPASTTKLATALCALRKFGPNYRFHTQALASDADLVITGNDFTLDKAGLRELMQALSDAGVKQIDGNVRINTTYTVALGSPSSVARVVRALLQEYFRFKGKVIVDGAAGGQTVLADVASKPLLDILKVMLCYSSNFLAEKIGSLIGGPAALRSELIANEKLDAGTLVIETASGLEHNRFTPADMMLVLRALDAELDKYCLSLSDVMQVAGVDEGTLLKRYQQSPERGSVIAKTGTLIQTDKGASALAGQVSTQNGGVLYFVIFHQRGNVPTMRVKQDQIIADTANRFGGAKPFNYLPRPLILDLGHS